MTLGFPDGALAKNLPTSAGGTEAQVQSLGREEPLESKMSTHSSYSCLENPMDREAWWATVCGAAKSRTQLSMQLTLSA